VDEAKYTVSKTGPRIEQFLDPILDLARLRVSPEVTEPENRYNDFENPELVVKFNGPDADLLLANKAELLLALEHLTTEVLRMGPNEHSLLCFDVNDFNSLRS